MDFSSAAFTLRVMAAAIMLLSLSLRASRLMNTDCLLIAVALGMAMMACAAVFAGDLVAFPWLFTGHVFSVWALQGTYGAFPLLHPVRTWRRMSRSRRPR